MIRRITIRSAVWRSILAYYRMQMFQPYWRFQFHPWYGIDLLIRFEIPYKFWYVCWYGIFVQIFWYNTVFCVKKYRINFLIPYIRFDQTVYTVWYRLAKNVNINNAGIIRCYISIYQSSIVGRYWIYGIGGWLAGGSPRRVRIFKSTKC